MCGSAASRELFLQRAICLSWSLLIEILSSDRVASATGWSSSMGFIHLRACCFLFSWRLLFSFDRRAFGLGPSLDCFYSLNSSIIIWLLLHRLHRTSSWACQLFFYLNF